MRRTCVLLVLGMMLFAGCQSEIVLTPVVRYDFDFNEGPQDWEAGFANYPAGQEAFFELASDWRQLPDPLEGMGMYITGHNHSADLFMFLKRQITGLEPNTRYSLSFDVTIATNVGKSCAGIGGAPGAVVVKGGVSTEEPVLLLDDYGDYRLSVDLGDLTVGGENVMVLGNIANTTDDCPGAYELKQLVSDSQTRTAVSDSTGSVWVFIGTQGGFEGRTGIYYVHATIEASPE